ncbi:solute carrier family 23 member 3-like isoform X2 [Heterodontus francisci]|uniref:solute carrier family 23 member 3-like isoform X2 n=1 Tax=Heterodontus francisci TaxID=7792 RepID=UPI00355BBDE0
MATSSWPPASSPLASPPGFKPPWAADTEVAELCDEAQCSETGVTLQTWKHTLCEIRGAVIVSGILQVLLGLSGLQGLMSRHCGPMVLAPMLSIIGLSCYKEVAHFSSSHWGVTALLILLVVLLSQHLRCCYIPIWRWKKSKGFEMLAHFPLFRIFSLLLPIVFLWILCGILREGDILNPYPAGGVRGILQTNSTYLVPWFSIPNPAEWGAPTINLRSTYIGITMALGASINSIGCYMMCAKAVGFLHPPRDACNRGICLEGVGSCIAVLLGGITATSSSIPNVGALALTQAESRHSVQIAAVLCILVGMSAKLIYFLTTIPIAIHGGVLSVTYTMAVSIGVSYFQYTNIDSGRNIFIIGFTVFMALLTPRWFIRNPDYIATGLGSLDIFLLALLMMPVIQGGFLAFLLDNTVSGTPEERGLVAQFPGFRSELEGYHHHQPKDLTNVYQLPSALRRYLCMKCFPFRNLCPSSETVQEPVAEGEETKDLLPTLELVASGGEAGVANSSRIVLESPGVQG